MARAAVRRESQLLEPVSEVTLEPVLWDDAADMNTYTEVETSESQRAEPQIVYLPPDSSDVYEEEVYLALNPSSSSAGAAFQSFYCDEPEPEPPADFGTDTE